MTTLLQRSQILDAKLKSLTLAKRHADDYNLIQQRTQEWNDRNEKLRVFRSRTACLTLRAEDVTEVTSKRAALLQNASTVLARLNQDDDINQLTRDAAWKRLLKSAEGLTEVLEAAGRKAWSAYLEERGTLEDPVALRLRTPPTPQNDEALRAYQASYAAYQVIARLSLPRTEEDLTLLTTHVAACRQAFLLLTFDLPIEVKRFFEAINAGSATLAQVTPSVLEWIAKNGRLDGFRVRSAGQ
ncbi:MAG: hypothetical protein NTV11_10145 [Rhodocyclales bacterium]|nr:hypothetical protein [Rhodocyclales bacterium]